MILDSFKLINFVFQIQYADSYQIWDRAGNISKQLCNIWPNLKLIEGQPQQQTLNGKNVSLQSGLNRSTITINDANAFDQLHVKQIKETLGIWHKELELNEFSRISARVTYAKNFTSLGLANNFIFDLKLARWPTSKVFDQPEKSGLNGLDLAYRFEDESSFSVLRVRAEQLKYEVDLNPEFVKNSEIRESICRAIIDFDRGLLGKVSAEKFRVDDWIKGYQHILRRDIEKVIKA